MELVDAEMLRFVWLALSARRKGVELPINTLMMIVLAVLAIALGGILFIYLFRDRAPKFLQIFAPPTI